MVIELLISIDQMLPYEQVMMNNVMMEILPMAMGAQQPVKLKSVVMVK